MFNYVCIADSFELIKFPKMIRFPPEQTTNAQTLTMDACTLIHIYAIIIQQLTSIQSFLVMWITGMDANDIILQA